MRRLLAVLSLTAFAAALVAGAAVAGSRGISDGTTAAGGVDTNYAMVQLKGDPLSTYPATKPAPGKKIDFDSSTVKSYRAQLNAQRNDFKQWLRTAAPNAQVSGQYDIALNAVSVQLNGTSLDTLRSSPLVVRADYEPTFTYQDDADPDLALISAIDAWKANGGAANAGKGIKIGILDTGIDISHPCFSDAGFPNTPQLGDKSFTNNKVIVAKVFNNQTPRFGYTPEALQEHGTHVAGTVACDFNTAASVDGVGIPYLMSGVAPAAQLGNYNVFPGDVLSVRWEDLLNALEAAYTDKMDVVNMSIGGAQPGIRSLVEMGINNLDQAGMISAVANGNAGPGFFTAEAPGSAARALTAGASTVPHFVGVDISGIPAATGELPTFGSTQTGLPLAVTSGDGALGLSKACSALSGVAGKVALVSRGDCTFAAKDRSAKAGGAIAVIIVNNVNGDPIAMAGDGGAAPIPAYMVALSNGATIKGMSTVTISGTKSYFGNTGNGDVLAGFSSRGPTDTDFRVKPDVVAPGVNVLSSIPHQFCAAPPCFAFFQGTSMATPHLAGSAAVVLSQHASWTPAQVRSAIVNTADASAITKTSGTGIERNPVAVGAGRENLRSAVNASLAFDPVSLSFGAVPSGSGQAKSGTIVVTNLSGSTQNVAVSISAPNTTGVTFAADKSSLSIPAGMSATVTITMTAAQGASAGHHYATLTIGSSHAALYTFVK